ncbi:hypothetical protein RSO01_93960 [Reyranella soli]|uniref:Uncharacterized protein n=1 Tax=Reyranella soli TaxID=1230389 RepID=A0A512NTF4_9HYPH|nr:hypothetical protein RSO01_93960 [Reyranella soli]
MDAAPASKEWGHEIKYDGYRMHARIDGGRRGCSVACSACGARTGIKGDQLDQVVADVVTAGLAERRVDDASLVMLTSKGWTIARN